MAGQDQDTDPAKNDTVSGLPKFLLKVPSGNVLMGMPVETFIEACSQAAYPFNPKFAYRDATKNLATAMRRSSSVIGRKPVPVDTFFLGKWPVKNSEYITYVDQRRAAKVDIRPPLHWWKDGCPEDYEEHLPEIRKAFPKNPKGHLYYWEREGHKLPYKLQNEKGESIADHPVVYVSWRDANKFAASIGMRLPTESELARAMRGDGVRTWPGGPDDPDKYTEAMKKLLGMAKTTDLRTKPVGTILGAAGPFGHVDMFGQVWQLVGDLGFQPIHSMDEFLKSWKALQKNKQGRLCERKPPFNGSKSLVKGGSYLSYGEPVQLMLDSRAAIETSDALESVGFRLAKSIAPGYDYLYSLQRIQFDNSVFAKDQALALDRLVGAERYTLAANDFPSSYEAIAFAPVNWLVDAKGMKLKKMAEESQQKPLLIGALASTAEFGNGTKPGLYSIFYRQKGIPRELRDAVKSGHKELVKARKEAEKKAKMDAKAGLKKKKKEDEPKKQKAVRKWRLVTKRYGLTDEDVLKPEAANGDLGFVTIDDVKIPTAQDAFIMSAAGKMISVIPGTKKKPTKGDPIPSSMTIEAGEDGKSLAKLQFGVPLMMSDLKKMRNIIVFDLHVLLDQPAPTEDQPWRLPNNQ
jgi:formylglycine-generating enzyme required for sulfatase activity